MEMISGNLPLILCALAGFALLMAEAFMPGFGVAGVSGIVVEVIAVYLAWTTHGAVFALVLTLVILAVLGVAIFFSYRSISRGRLSKGPLVLQDTEATSATEAEAMSAWIGKEGKTVTSLRPVGTVELEGSRVSAASDGALIEKGAAIRVTGVKGDHLIVRAI